jgi:hypothetical protein
VELLAASSIDNDTIISTDKILLTHLLAPFVCGFGKLVVFNHLKVVTADK